MTKEGSLTMINTIILFWLREMLSSETVSCHTILPTKKLQSTTEDSFRDGKYTTHSNRRHRGQFYSPYHRYDVTGPSLDILDIKVFID